MAVNGEAIRDQRVALGYSQEKLASMADVTRRTIQRAEAGQAIAPETLAFIADALETEASNLLIEDSKSSQQAASFDFGGAISRLIQIVVIAFLVFNAWPAFTPVSFNKAHCQPMIQAIFREEPQSRIDEYTKACDRRWIGTPGLIVASTLSGRDYVGNIRENW